MNYWLNLFTAKSWREFLDAGGMTSGFSEGRWNTVQKLKKGDRLLCYLTGISRFVGVVEVTSDAFQSDTPIWSESVFPSRINVRILVALSPETAIPVLNLKDRLQVFQNLKSPGAWTGHFRGSPAKWRSEDGEAIYKALFEESHNPVQRAIDPRKLAYSPKTMKTKMGQVTVPEPDEVERREPKTRLEQVDIASNHERMQLSLAKLGGSLGLDVWIARNDRNRIVNGQRLCDLPRVLSDLPVHFDQVTNRTVQLIDVLWLKGKAIVAAFEIESTTSVYSGLLRMADLIAMQPNINVPLYIVAPDDRREKVLSEIGRPTFSSLQPPMREMCRFLPFGALEQKIEQATQFVAYLKPDFIDEVAEFYEPDEDGSDEDEANS